MAGAAAVAVVVVVILVLFMGGVGAAQNPECAAKARVLAGLAVFALAELEKAVVRRIRPHG